MESHMETTTMEHCMGTGTISLFLCIESEYVKLLGEYVFPFMTTRTNRFSS